MDKEYIQRVHAIDLLEKQKVYEASLINSEGIHRIHPCVHHYIPKYS